MKTLAIDSSPRFLTDFESGMLASPIGGDFMLEILGKARTVYLLDDIVAQGLDFKADRLVDEDGETHTVEFPIIELRDEETGRWAIGENYQINLTEFFNRSQLLIEQFLQAHPEKR